MEKREPLCTAGGDAGAATVENSMEGPQKIKNGTALSLSNLTSGYIFEETQNTDLKGYIHLCVHCNIAIIVKIWKQPMCPSVEE